MGKLVAVVGNTGVGKTTFVAELCRRVDFTSALEQHEERPFQELFSQDHQKYALANQVDYLLLRARQEKYIRLSNPTGVQDGGLDQDYYIFTKLFYQKGYLTQSEFVICQRMHILIRDFLPPPELIVWLKAPVDLIQDRFQERDRRLSIAQVEDLRAIENLLHAWLGGKPAGELIIIDAAHADQSYSNGIQELSSRLATIDDRPCS